MENIASSTNGRPGESIHGQEHGWICGTVSAEYGSLGREYQASKAV